MFASHRSTSPSATVAPPSGAPPQLVPLYDVDAPLRELYAEIADCPRCELARTRSRTVPGSGPLTSELMFIGEGPGQREDELGLPFVGRAGQFLDELLAGIGLTRSDVYVCNVVKCRPPGNRDPLPEELAACGDYLERQIALVNPRVIATLGRFSMARWFADARITRIHGQAAEFDGRTVIPMYHPAAALRNPALREVMKQDFALIPALLSDDARAERAVQPIATIDTASTRETIAAPRAPATPPLVAYATVDPTNSTGLAPEWRDPPQERLL